MLGQQIGDFVDGNAEFSGHFLHLSRTKSLLDLLGVDWKIGAGGYPRLGMLAKAGLLKFRDDAKKRRPARPAE